MGRHRAILLTTVAACSTAERTNDVDAQSRDGSGSNILVDGGDDPTGDAMPDAQITPVGCGNGMPDNGEACDDNNTASNDGCSSICTLEPMQSVTVTGLNLSITDDGYNGMVSSMACANVSVGAWYTPTIASATVTVGMDHNWVGDVVLKAIAPDNTTVTLVSRPGYTEPADDGTGPGLGNSAVLSKLYPITFATGAGTSAESMGATIATVCSSDNVCMFAPNSGAAAAGTLAAFNGKSSTGTWKLCAGDAGNLETGKLDRTTFTFTH